MYLDLISIHINLRLARCLPSGFAGFAAFAAFAALKCAVGHKVTRVSKAQSRDDLFIECSKSAEKFWRQQGGRRLVFPNLGR
jgi:hypothetical protein